MSFLLDTCVISELRKPTPSPAVTKWFQTVENQQLCISSLTLGELQYGISQLADGTKKTDLITWFESMETAFSEQTFPVTNEIAMCWGRTRAQLRTQGIQLPVIDGLLAATCSIHGLTMVTRNTADFKATEIQLLNPWE